ncbi:MULTISPECIES: hypothetical protein [unclassified Streptomyces]|uniref:hypothetical protein n=1 Tax=unclassified Streptomyces TaxID=2593676 RepID=UPI00081D47F5|nr:MULTISPECIES: hypothetical protein [unclassified Streptomyces]MYZ37907.1 hypothetical protein [Streptomyces sp. SID4917]SCF95078.1 hypothetical protein GA0115259_105469 [Streptomyces sp. MnatMP-M17]
MDRPPNARLMRVIEQSGLSYEDLARAVRAVASASGNSGIRTSKSNIAYWVRGTPPNPPTARYLLEVLSRRLARPLTLDEIGLPPARRDSEPDALGLTVEGDPVETLGHIGRADIERRTFLTRAAYSVAGAALPLGAAHETEERTKRAVSGGTAGASEVEAVRDMVAMFTAIDERHGGQHGRSTVVQYLTDDVKRLCSSRFRTEALRQEMYSAAGSLAYLAGWKAFDADEHGLAQRYYLQAYSLARRADNPADQAYALRILAHHGMDNGRPEHVLGLAEKAVSLGRGKVDPVAESLFVICRARALAESEQITKARHEADRARELAARGERAEMGWAVMWGAPSATVAAHTAKIHERLGDHAAAERYHASARKHYGSTQHQRIAALSAAAEGHAQLRQGQIERACETWGLALDAMSGIRSSRTRKAVRSIRADLGRFRARGARPALELDERARTWLRQPA